MRLRGDRGGGQDDDAGSGPGGGPALALAALYVVGVLVYGLLGHRNVIPSISPDEFTYGHLARSIADGDGLSWRGQGFPLRSPLYLYAIAPAWLGSSTTSAYALAKLIGAALCALVVVPVWLLARRAAGPWLALVPAALALAGTWMLVTAGVLTENAAYPAGVAALAATVAAVRQPASRWPWAALGLTVVAAACRSQLAVLILVLPLAALADALRAGRPGLRAGIARQRRTLAAGGALAVIAIVVALTSKGALGVYAGVQDYTPSLGALLASAGRHAVGLAAMAGLLPAIIVLALSASRAAWSDDELGPLLAVFWAATLVLIAEVAWYMAGGGRTWHIERYVMYVVPLGLTIAFAALVRARPSWRALAITTVVLAALLLLAAPLRNVSEEEGVFGLFRPLHGLLGTSLPLSLALVALLTGAAATALVHRGPAAPAGLVAALAALSLGVFVVQDAAAWSWRLDAVRAVRADRPKDLRWLDHAAHGPVARIVVATNATAAAWTEFFNRDIAQVYVPAPQIGVVGGPRIFGRTCTWNVAADGGLQLAPGCGPAPSRFLLDDEVAKLTLAGQRVVSDQPAGRLVEVTGPAPRLLALVFLPCGPRLHRIVIGDDGVARRAGRVAACSPQIRGNLWPGGPGRLELRFRGGTTDQHVAAAGRTTTLPSGRTTLVSVGAPGRPTAFDFQLDWTGTGPGLPELIGLDLVRGAERTDLMGAPR